MSLRGRGLKGRGTSRKSLGSEREKCEGCGEGEVMEEGRTSGARSNEGDVCHTNRTAPTTVHSHTRRGYLTTRLTTKHHFSQGHPTTPSGTRDEQAVLHTPFGVTSPSARRCGRRDDVSSSPFHSDVTGLPSQQKHHPNPHPSRHPLLNNHAT